MDCPGCGLYNLDHVTHCIKCGMQLQGGPPADFDPHPPRAGRFNWFFNLYYAWRRNGGYLIPEGLESTRGTSRRWSSIQRTWHSAKGAIGSAPVAALNIIPGLGSLVAGQRHRAIIFFSLFVFCIFGALILYGHESSGYFIGFIVCIQAMAIFDLFPRSSGSYLEQLGYNLAVILVIFFICYYFVAIYLFGEYDRLLGGVRLGLLFSGPVLYAGDYVQVVPRDNYKRRDILFYQTPRGFYQSGAVFGGMIDAVDRVLAEPGEKVKIKDGKIYINDSKEYLKVRPIARDISLQDMEFTLGKDQYMIFHSYARMPRDFNRHAVQRFITIDKKNIRGKVDKVLFPLWRRRNLN